MQIDQLKTNHITNPLGYDLSSIRLSWIVNNNEGNSLFQTHAQVEISMDSSFSKVVFDSGKQMEIDSRCYMPSLELSPRTRYFWRVTVWGDQDEVATSDYAWFETAKMNEAWQGQWITSSLEQSVHPIMRKDFHISEPIVQARAYICGVGLYEVELNGEKVGNEYLAPGYHAYDYWLQYQTYDVTSLLVSGSNAIGVTLGNGWYKGRFGFDGGYTNLYGDEFAFLAEIVVTLADGTEKRIGSDQSWRSTQSPVVSSNIYDGEIYDANLIQMGWSTPNFDDSNWETVRLTEVATEKLQARLSVPIKVMEQRKPVQVIQTPKGETVLDFGQVMTGWVKFKATASKGTQLKLQYGEILQDKCFYRDNLRTAQAEYVYTSDGIDREVEPLFTFFGFRYVKFEGFADPIQLEDFTGCVVYSELETTGSITTSDPLVNQLFQNAMWGQKGNFLDVPTDCPQRDERMGWTGDAQVFAATACYNMNAAPFFHKYMVDLHEEQKRINGSVPFTVPTVKPKEANGFINGHGSSAWGDAATIIPWTLYQMYGDKQLLSEHYSAMVDWVNYIKGIDDATGGSRLWQVGFHFGDWLALDGLDPNSPLGGTDSHYVASAYYCYSAELVAKAAKVLGKDEDYAAYTKLAGEIRTAILTEYFTATGRSAIYTQTALIVALYMNLVPDALKGRVIADLKKKLKEDKYHLTTGFVGTPYICHVLSQNNLNKEAYTLLLNEDFPSWLYAVKLGATTIWERWNSVLEDGTISRTGMNSLNHYAYGSVVEWMYKHMGGIQTDEQQAGFKKMNLAPKPYGKLQFSHATFNSPFGKVESRWEIKPDGRLVFQFTVPFNVTARVTLPDASAERVVIISGKPQLEEGEHNETVSYQLYPGRYEFEYEPLKSYLIRMNSEWTVRELVEYPEAVAIIEQLAPGLLDIEFVKAQFIDMPFQEMIQIPLFSSFQLNVEQLNEKLATVTI